MEMVPSDVVSPVASTARYSSPDAETSFIYKTKDISSPVDLASDASDATSSVLQAQIQEAEALCRLASLKRQLAEEQQKVQSDCASERSRASRRERLKHTSASSCPEQCVQKPPILAAIG